MEPYKGYVFGHMLARSWLGVFGVEVSGVPDSWKGSGSGKG